MKLGGTKLNIITYRTALNEDKLCHLDKISSVEYEEEGKIDNPEKLVRLMTTVFGLHAMSDEYVDILCYDVKMNLIGVLEVSHGQMAQCDVSIREVLQKALLCNAYSIILVHNHPSGDITPSSNDDMMYESVKEGCKAVGLYLYDSIIVGKEFQSGKILYHSYYENTR